MKYRLLLPAVQEIQETVDYYEKQASGLGYEFLEEVRATIRRIVVSPEAWIILEGDIRRCRTRRFPYGVIYSIENDVILVISLIHLRRHPESWKQNLEN